MTETKPLSLWDASAAETTLASPLDGDCETDVAIVGGGFTGLSTALHAAQHGVRCHVLEAQTIGHGGSGRNAGLVNAGLWLPPQDVRAAMGEERGGALIGALSDAPETVFTLIEQHQIRCEATRNGTIHAAHAPSGFKDLERRASEWQRLGAPVELLSKDRAAEMIGSDRFHGGLLDHRAGTINPMGYVCGLARAAKAAGADISTGVTVRGLKRQGDSWQLSTSHGLVTALRVVLATNAYTDQLWPGLSETYIPIHYFQLATIPYGERTAGVLPGGQGLWDTGLVMSSLRRDTFGRLIVGTMGRVIESAGVSQRWAERRLKHLFPTLGPVEFEHAWHGKIAMTPDHLPRILRLDEGLYTPIGYNGRGIGPGTVFGRAIADYLAGADERDLPMPISSPRQVRRAPIMRRVYDLAFTANQFVKSI